jgi:hypothetical protein
MMLSGEITNTDINKELFITSSGAIIAFSFKTIVKILIIVTRLVLTM